jgi:hypothetical protein
MGRLFPSSPQVPTTFRKKTEATEIYQFNIKLVEGLFKNITIQSF